MPLGPERAAGPVLAFDKLFGGKALLSAKKGNVYYKLTFFICTVGSI
jgi:hypothetical protein